MFREGVIAECCTVEAKKNAPQGQPRKARAVCSLRGLLIFAFEEKRLLLHEKKPP